MIILLKMSVKNSYLSRGLNISPGNNNMNVQDIAIFSLSCIVSLKKVSFNLVVQLYSFTGRIIPYDIYILPHYTSATFALAHARATICGKSFGRRQCVAIENLPTVTGQCTCVYQNRPCVTSVSGRLLWQEKAKNEIENKRGKNTRRPRDGKIIGHALWGRGRSNKKRKRADIEGVEGSTMIVHTPTCEGR